MPKHEPEDDDIQLSMLENGLDFIATGLKHIASPGRCSFVGLQLKERSTS